MIVLDTNVISELIRRIPDPNVLIWSDALPVAEVALTAVTVGELSHGVLRLPPGRGRDELAVAVQNVIGEDFDGRIVPYDADAAVAYGHVVAGCERRGRPISVSDAQIAAICRSRDATLATRNIRDFDHTGVELIDPWAAR